MGGDSSPMPCSSLLHGHQWSKDDNNSTKLKLSGAVSHGGNEVSHGELCKPDAGDQCNGSSYASRNSGVLQHHASTLEFTPSSKQFFKHGKYGADSLLHPIDIINSTHCFSPDNQC